VHCGACLTVANANANQHTSLKPG